MNVFCCDVKIKLPKPDKWSTFFEYILSQLRQYNNSKITTITSNIPSACQIIDNLTCTRGYFGRLFPENNLHDK
jgi:hypothetical protein